MNNIHKKDRQRVASSFAKKKAVERHTSGLPTNAIEDSDAPLLPDDDNNECDTAAGDIVCDTMADATGLAAKMFGITACELATIPWSTCNGFGLDLGFPNGSRSSFYFKEAFLGLSEAAGLEYLVRRSHLKKNYADIKHMPGSTKAIFKLSDEQALIQIQIAELSFTLSPTDKERLVEVINGAYAMGYKNGSEDARTRFQQDISMFAHNTDLIASRLGQDDGLKHVANKPTMIFRGNSFHCAKPPLPGNSNQYEGPLLHSHHTMHTSFSCPSAGAKNGDYPRSNPCLHWEASHKAYIHVSACP